MSFVLARVFKVFLAETRSSDNKEEHHRVVVVGGGSAGIAVAAQLKKKLEKKDNDVAIIEPSEKHYYQPLWTMVGGGIFKKEASVRDEASLIPSGAKWIKTSVSNFAPDENFVTTADGKKIKYDYLVVATGLELNWEGVKGLKDSIGKNGVCSNYSYDYVDKTFDFLKNTKEGTMIFTTPEGAVKCGGAPQKIMWLADDYLRKQGIRDKVKITFSLPAGVMFGVKKYSDVLDQMRVERNIDVMFKSVLVEVRGEQKEAVFKLVDSGELKTMKYDFLHVTPPMRAPGVVRTSPLAAANGYVDVDKFTLQHNKYKNVFSLGDSANLPTSKTIAAVTQQSPVLVSNLLSTIRGEPLKAKYDGYTSCPIVTGYNKLILAEFLYDGVPKETFPWNQAIPSRTMYMVKEQVFPRVYWHLFLKGHWYGPNTVFWPTHQ